MKMYNETKLRELIKKVIDSRNDDLSSGFGDHYMSMNTYHAQEDLDAYLKTGETQSVRPTPPEGHKGIR